MAGILTGKIALVTGGASGIGRASALALCKAGAEVVLADVNDSASEETLSLMHTIGGEGMFVNADVSKRADVERLMQRIGKTYGRVDCAHNNAGIEGPIRLTGDYCEREWDSVVNVNLKGVWLCMVYEIRIMLMQGSGVIVNTSSAAGLKGFPYHAAYSSSKHAIIGLSKTAAQEYAKKGIRINVVCPGFIRVGLTEQAIKANPGIERKFRSLIPMGRFGEGEEVAEAVVWLCSDAASFVTGQTLVVDGGASA
jgi:NAD(P)-dependent dehydrogenase (short-subunit alcohol dehydrogenase family)